MMLMLNVYKLSIELNQTANPHQQTRKDTGFNFVVVLLSSFIENMVSKKRDHSSGNQSGTVGKRVSWALKRRKGRRNSTGILLL